MTTALAAAHLDAPQSPPLLVLITCSQQRWLPSAWCDTENRAKRAAASLAAKTTGWLNVTHTSAGALLPLESLQLSAHTDLPALILLDASAPEKILSAPGRLWALPADRGAPPPETEHAWQQRMWEFVHFKASAPFRAVVRSASPPPTSVLRRDLSAPLVSTADSLEADLTAAGHCGLLLVHDSRLDAASDAAAAPPERWHALAANLAERFPPPAPRPHLLQLDAASNDVPGSPLGLALRTALHSSGLPAYVRVTPSRTHPHATFASVPARRVRATAALLNWAVAHAQSCARGAAGSASAASSSAASSSASSWVQTFVTDGLPALEAALGSALRTRTATSVRTHAAALALHHEALRPHLEEYGVTATLRALATEEATAEATAESDAAGADASDVQPGGPRTDGEALSRLLGEAEWQAATSAAVRTALREAVAAVTSDAVAGAGDLHAAAQSARVSLNEATTRLIALNEAMR